MQGLSHDSWAVASKEAYEVIRLSLERLYPSIPIISEDNKLKDFATRSLFHYCFCVDALRGTKVSNFNLLIIYNFALLGVH